MTPKPDKPARAPKPARTPIPFWTFAESGSSYGPTPLAPTVDPEAWSRYPKLPHDCTPDHPGTPERAHTCRPAYNPDGLTDVDAIRAAFETAHKRRKLAPSATPEGGSE